MNTIQDIKDNAVYKQVISDSFGGIMYNVADQDKYDDTEIIAAWEALTPGERAAADGIITGALGFLTDKNI